MEENDIATEVVDEPTKREPTRNLRNRYMKTKKKPGRIWTDEQKEKMRQVTKDRLAKMQGLDIGPLPPVGSPSVDAEIAKLQTEMGSPLAKVAEEVQEKVEQAITKPTTIKHAVTAPWRPARLMDIPKHLMNPNYKYRFVNTLKPGNVMKKKQEGWEMDTELQSKLDGIQGKTIDDARSSLDSATPVRELILMRMPAAMAKARADYYQSVTIDPTKPGVMKKTLKNNADEDVEDGTTPMLYGDVEIRTANTRR